MDYNRFLSEEAKRFTNASLIGLIHRFTGVDGVISLAGGLPPAEAFPVTDLTAKTVDGLEISLGAEGRQAYLAQQYNFNPQGYDPLLDWLRALTARLHAAHLVAPTASLPQQQPPSPQAKQGEQQDTPAHGRRAGPDPAGSEAAPAGPEPGAVTPELTSEVERGGGGAAGSGDAAGDATAGGGGGVAAPGPLRDLVLTSGAIHAIFAVISCLTGPGDTIVVDEYTYTHALECVFLPRGLRLLPVRGDEEGMDPEDLDHQLQQAGRAAAAGQGRRPKLLYVVPTGHNPTGAVMTEARKRRILQVCEAHDLLVLEDDAYYWLYYPRTPAWAPDPRSQAGLEGLPPSLLRLDGSGRVVRVDTFSKLLGPGYRLGWITAPAPLVGKLANWIQATTVGPCSVSQVLVARMLQQWGQEGFRAYVRRTQALYAARAAAAQEAASQHLRGLAEWYSPRAGMFMWLRLTGGLDAGSLIDDLVEAKVVGVPGGMFATRGRQATVELDPVRQSDEVGQEQDGEPRTGSPCLRVSFAGSPPEVFEEGMRRLASVIRAAQARLLRDVPLETD